jgi:enoyl-CoA hydratase
LSPLSAYDVDGRGVALLRLNRPEARNAINMAMLEELLEHLRTAREDAAVRVLVISSTDHMGLSAGADIRERLDEEGTVRWMQLFADPYDAIVACPKPTVAACHATSSAAGPRSRSPATWGWRAPT